MPLSSDATKPSARLCPVVNSVVDIYLPYPRRQESRSPRASAVTQHSCSSRYAIEISPRRSRQFRLSQNGGDESIRRWYWPTFAWANFLQRHPSESTPPLATQAFRYVSYSLLRGAACV